MVLAQSVAVMVLAACLLYLLMQLKPLPPDEADELWEGLCDDVGEMFAAPGNVRAGKTDNEIER